MTKFKPTLNSLLKILCILALCAFVSSTGWIKGLPPSASADTDDWSGHSEHFTSGSVATSAPAVIDTAVTFTAGTAVNTNAKLRVKSITMAGGTAGLYTFFSGSTPSGANQIGQFYLIANTPTTLTTSMFRGGMSTVGGQGIYCVGAGTLTWTAVVRTDLSN